jgi:hypothetical protein
VELVSEVFRIVAQCRLERCHRLLAAVGQSISLAGVDLRTGKETRYRLERDWWSVHYNVSRDGTLFAGDGGDPGQVAFAQDGRWINLFRPQPDGTLTRERLVELPRERLARCRRFPSCKRLRVGA